MGLDLTAGASGASGSERKGDQLDLLLCESGIELAPECFQSIVGRLGFGGTPLGSFCEMLGLPLKDGLVFVDAVAAVVVVLELLLVVEGILAVVVVLVVVGTL